MSNQQVVPVPATSLYTIIFPQDYRSLYDSSFYNQNLYTGSADIIDLPIPAFEVYTALVLAVMTRTICSKSAG